MASLEIHDARGRRDFRLEEAEVSCGRAEDNDIVLGDSRCSKRHCRLSLRNGRWRVSDLASANGTRLNGQPVSMAVLEDGDRIAIGDVEIVFRAGPGRAPEIGRGEAAARGSAKLPLVLAGLAVVAALLVWAALGGDDEPAPVASGESADVAGAPDPAAESPGSEEQFLRAALRTEWAAIAADGFSPADRLIARAREFAARAAAVDADLGRKAAAFADERDQAETARLRARLQEIGSRGLEESAAGRFADSLAELDAVMVELQALDQQRLLREARSAKLDLLGRARARWEAIAQESDRLAAAGDFQGARRLLVEAAPGFGGTAFEAVARSSVQLLEIRARGHEADVAAVARETTEAKGEETPVRREKVPARPVEKVDDGAAGLIAEAEKAAAGRDWRTAAKGYAQALELARGEALTRSWTRRSELLSSLARLKDRVVIAVNAEDRRVKSLKIGRLSARPQAADQESIELKFGGSGVVTWLWREIPGETLLDLFQAGLAEAEDQLDYARAAIEFGDQKRAVAALVRAAAKSSLKDEADRVFAAWRGRDVPPGGFIVEEGGFFGPDEWAAIELRRSARKEAEKLVKARRAQLPELVAQLRAMGEPAAEPLQTALVERYERVVEDAGKLSFVAAPGRYRGKLLEELDRRRAEALALIRDEKRYPYPYGPNQEEVEREVTALVERVRQVYEQPSLFLLDKEKGLEEVLSELEEIVGLMIVPAEERPKPSSFLDLVDRAIDMRTHGRSAGDQRANEEVAVFNAEIRSSITAEEREVHRLTNEYRMMMGLRAVKIDEALVLAARGHSQEMKDLGYFSHTSPTKGRERPGDRCRLAGWGGSASENIAQGQRTPEGAVQGWIHSSGHHRNILGPRWTHLGCGKAKDGFYWTQNFGSGSSSSISKEKIDEAEAGAAEKEAEPRER